jgi:hypothetical protein
MRGCHCPVVTGAIASKTGIKSLEPVQVYFSPLQVEFSPLFGTRVVGKVAAMLVLWIVVPGKGI